MKIGIITFACALTTAACAGGGPRASDNPTATADRENTTTHMVSATDASVAMTSDAVALGTTAAMAPPRGDSGGSFNRPGVADPTDTVDNTAINDRDRNGPHTPLHQANRDSETKITAAIRRSLMSDKTLSFTAKNVKVITVGTTVTLRGPVMSGHEKATIEGLAKHRFASQGTAGGGTTSRAMRMKNTTPSGA